MSAARRIADRLHRFCGARGGTAAVEFALVLPLLALLLFGAIDLGRLLADYQVAEQGMRDAGRFLSRADPAALDLDCALGVVDHDSAPAREAMNLVMTGTVDGSGGFALGYWTDSSSLAAAGIAIAVQCADNGGGELDGLYAGTAAVPSVQVSAAIPFPLLNGWLLGRGATLDFTVRHRAPHVGGGWGL